MISPFDVVRQFEQAVAEFAGAKHGVAVDSCTNAIYLSLLYRGAKNGVVWCPRRTYPSVPMAIVRAGARVVWTAQDWIGAYELSPYRVVDAAKRFKRNMYWDSATEFGNGVLWCCSFHAKKHLPIGNGGMVLTDDAAAARWLRLMRFDGREECALVDQKDWPVIGHHCLMGPDQAARGLWLLGALLAKHPDGLPDQDEVPSYPDCSTFACFSKE